MGLKLMAQLITAIHCSFISFLEHVTPSGWSVFWGLAGGATGAPMLPLLYIGANLAFNIAALNLVRSAGNVITSLVRTTACWDVLLSGGLWVIVCVLCMSLEVKS